MIDTPSSTRLRKSTGHGYKTWTALSTAAATLLACAVLLPLLGHKPLTNWDEGIYAEVSHEMLVFGPLVPHWNFQPWFEKPPLMLWITAAFFKLFGVTEFWARAGSAFSGVAIVSLLHVWLARRGDLLAAWLSTLLLLSTFGFLHVCRVGEMDVLLSLGCTIALCGLAAVQDRELSGWSLFWAGLAIALMTKGAACIVLVLAALLFAALERWNLTRLARSFWLGLCLFAAAVLPWHLYMLHRFGQPFLSEYLGFHVLARATHPIEDHLTHWWYYAWVLLISAAPLVLIFPFAILQSLRRKELRVWAIFAITVVIFFTLVQTRLPHYISPAYPALALLTSVYLADHLRTLRQSSRRSPTSFWAISIAAGVAVCLVTALLTTGPRRRLHQAKAGPTTIAAEKESVALLQNVFHSPPRIPGPLLVWWPGDQRSIATSVFYSRRAVQQVQLEPLPANTPTDKYLFQPETMASATSSGPRVILLDKDLASQIPADLKYTPILADRLMEAGVIEAR